MASIMGEDELALSPDTQRLIDGLKSTDPARRNEAVREVNGLLAEDLLPAPLVKHQHPCATIGCPGDGRYAAPGRGYLVTCTYPRILPPGVTEVESGCTCGGIAACPQCQERDATRTLPPGNGDIA